MGGLQRNSPTTAIILQSKLFCNYLTILCDYLTMVALNGLSEGRFHATCPKKQKFSIRLDVLHGLMDIERQAGPRPGQHVVAARENTASDKDVRLGSAPRDRLLSKLSDDGVVIAESIPIISGKHAARFKPFPPRLGNKQPIAMKRNGPISGPSKRLG